MPKRVFIGIRPDNETIKNIKTFQEEFSHLPIHWAREENIHITLVPPWRPKNFEEDLSIFQDFSPIYNSEPLTFTKIQIFKTKSILWATGQAPESLINLINRLTSSFNLPPQKRKYIMHITLAKHVDPAIYIPKIQILWEFVPESLILFESIQRKTGTIYNKISEIPLA